MAVLRFSCVNITSKNPKKLAEFYETIGAPVFIQDQDYDGLHLGNPDGLAARVEATGIYVLSGHGMKHRADIAVQVMVVDGIGEAADQIIAKLCGQEP